MKHLRRRWRDLFDRNYCILDENLMGNVIFSSIWGVKSPYYWT